MLKLETISKHLNEKQKAEFFDLFWDIWTTNGFGTLTKKDTELLIYTALKHVLADEAPNTNYEWATFLRLTPSRIKSIRLESHLRFGQNVAKNSAKELVDFFCKFTKLQSLQLNGLEKEGDLNEVTVSFVVEDPVMQMELEQMLKGIGSYLDYHRNREVVRISLINLFKIIGTEAQQDQIDKWVTRLTKMDKEKESIFGRVKEKGYSNKTEGAKVMLFIDDLASFAKVKSLTDHLKLILKSQKERS
ncbi:MAG: hypothetical protein ACI9SQ_000313 [Rubritalea sp.]|jgi:hypothetical protein